MKKSKEIELLELYGFLENQNLDWIEEFRHTLKQTEKDLLELHELYFHGKDCSGHPLINQVDYFVGIYLMHVERYLQDRGL